MSESKRIDFSIPWVSVDEVYQKVIKKYQPHVKTAGFRKGKVPTKMVEQLVGLERLFQETAEQVIPPAYVDAVKKADAKPITDPEIHPTKMEIGQDWEFHAHIAEKPEIKLGKYQEIVKKALKDFDKKEAEAAKTESKKDSKKEPVKEASDSQTPEQKAAALKDKQLNAILTALRDSIKPIVPELLVKQEAQHQIDTLMRQLAQFNIKKESYFASMGKSEQDVQAEFVGRALATWQLELIIDAVATDQKLEVTEPEIDAFIAKNYAPDHKLDASQRVQVQGVLRKEKALDYLQNLVA